MSLASTLAADPKVVAEVWHKEKFRSDVLLGTADVPLAPLLAKPWVDQPVSVYATMARAGQEDGAEGAEEQVQVGRVWGFGVEVRVRVDMGDLKGIKSRCR